MKLIVDKDLLSSSVNFVTRMIPARPPSPILSGMLIEAKNEKVTLSTFNYETSAKVEFSANVIEGGKVLVPGTLISSISQKLPDEPVEISKEDEKISLTCETDLTKSSEGILYCSAFSRLGSGGYSAIGIRLSM